uniref:Putative glutathione S-transferase epsilon class member 1 n=1 Tax=Leptinotarsa decemlineata TaxID=7539 RepID=A0A1P8PEU4_LEPDE|nr:putative glutathione S-transferase epsilon class member 1 [Leptinotarsa decemlineata]
MAPKLYSTILSPCVRAVLLCAKALGVELEIVEVDVVNGDQLKNEFLKLNPQHTVPTLVDDGVVVWDSHAIMIYLAEKYGKENPLYPSDPSKRAIINQRLFFDSGDLFSKSTPIAGMIIFGGVKQIPEKNAKALSEAYGFLEAFLERGKYFAGDDMTIADFSIWTTMTNASCFVPIDEKIYPNITAWMKLMGTLPYQELNAVGGGLFRDLVESSLAKS